MTKLYNRRCDLYKRRALRSRMTEAEQVLWQFLRKKKLKGHRFRRQFSIKGFVVDFYCPRIKTAVEVDGGYHTSDDQILYDKERDHILSGLGIKVIRVTNKEVLSKMKKTFAAIADNIESISPLERGRCPKGRGGGNIVKESHR